MVLSEADGWTGWKAGERPLPSPAFRKWKRSQHKCALIKQQAWWRADFFGPVCSARDPARVLSWGSHRHPLGNRLPRWTPNSLTWPSKQWAPRHPQAALPALCFHFLTPSATPPPLRKQHSLVHTDATEVYCMRGGVGQHSWPFSTSDFQSFKVWLWAHLTCDMGSHAHAHQPTTKMRRALRRNTPFHLFLLNAPVP